jgi:hypothetical protein
MMNEKQTEELLNSYRIPKADEVFEARVMKAAHAAWTAEQDEVSTIPFLLRLGGALAASFVAAAIMGSVALRTGVEFKPQVEETVAYAVSPAYAQLAKLAPRTPLADSIGGYKTALEQAISKL